MIVSFSFTYLNNMQLASRILRETWTWFCRSVFLRISVCFRWVTYIGPCYRLMLKMPTYIKVTPAFHRHQLMVHGRYRGIIHVPTGFKFVLFTFYILMLICICIAYIYVCRYSAPLSNPVATRTGKHGLVPTSRSFHDPLARVYECVCFFPFFLGRMHFLFLSVEWCLGLSH
jgi:hypothetical protein